MIPEPSTFVHAVYPVAVGWIIRLNREGEDDVFAVSVLADLLEQRTPVASTSLTLNHRYAIEVDHLLVRVEHDSELIQYRIVCPWHKKRHAIDGLNLSEYVYLFQEESHPWRNRVNDPADTHQERVESCSAENVTHEHRQPGVTLEELAHGSLPSGAGR